MNALRRPLPPNRTFEQLKNHFEVERALALKLKKASREERKRIYGTMYDELFQKVPDHPRLTSRENPQMIDAANRSKFALIKRFIHRETVFVEFAPGDCRFAMSLCSRVKWVYGVDISDQRGAGITCPENFKLIIYDGYNLELDDASVDIVFSDQLIEHLHPEDTIDHFRLVKRILKKNGVYVFRTPHRYSGPHDISGYFSDVPQGFHLKEWTYAELSRLLESLSFASWRGIYQIRGYCAEMPLMWFSMAESVLGMLPGHWRVALTPHILRGIAIAAYP